MADNWTKKFSNPVKPRDGKPIKTLADARAYMLAMPDGLGTRPEWQRAIEAALAAAKGKAGMDAARDALTNALFINMRLDLNGE